ncbi:MAG: ATP-binding cassette domain-containing protein [Ilumatobacteraceae bacterium]
MTAIVATGISKKFRMSQSRSSVKDRLARRGGGDHQDFWALRELDVTVEQGETVGILGHNGSGKSTLLKCIAGILKPTTGQVQVRGRVASLLELGAGFHPDLTGRENVFINAAFLGISKREIERRFDDIVAFAELERFIDQQVKYYSSGMFVRLGFATAINVEPDVLLVDEVLAVGDEAFQQKCLERVENRRERCTILLMLARITSGGSAAGRSCSITGSRSPTPLRAKRSESSVSTSTARSTRAAPEPSPIPIPAFRSGRSRFGITRSLALIYVLPGEPVDLAIEFEATEPVTDSVLALELHNDRGDLVYGITSDAIGAPCDVVRSEASWWCR